MSLCQSKDQAEAKPGERGERAVPFPLRIRRILLPGSPVSRGRSAEALGGHTSDDLDLCDSVGVAEDHTNLRGGGTLLCKFAYLLDNLLWGGLEPAGGVSEYIRCSGFPRILGATNQLGGVREYGIADAEIPFPLE